jgi:uncharacterized HhH-GPD family protein
MAKTKLPITGNVEADALLAENPFALLLGMLLDQQVSMEWAFVGPYRLRERLGASLDAAALARLDPGELEALFREKPALHRYPGAMAKRAHALAAFLVEHYGGDAGAVWRDAGDGAELLTRLRALPGFGQEKARIFVALLAKRFSVRPRGWQAAAGPFADATPRSVADIDSAAALERVRDFKRAQKAQGKGKGKAE